MRLRKLIGIAPIIALALLQPACWLTTLLGFVTPGFRVKAVVVPAVGTGQGGQPAPAPMAFISGSHRGDLPFGAVGWRMAYGESADRNGKKFIFGGRTQAFWEHRATFMMQTSPSRVDIAHQGGTLVDQIPMRPTTVPPSTARFAIAGQAPAEFTLGGTGLSSAHCLPQLDVYGQNEEVVFSTSATAVAADGSSATFAYPRKPDGSPLDPHMYAMAIVNCDTPDEEVCDPIYDEWGNLIGYDCYTIPGQQSAAGYNFTTVGVAENVPSHPFGVDVADDNVEVYECQMIWVDDQCEQFRACGHFEQHCYDWSYTDSRTVLTLNGSGEVLYDGNHLPVGAGPTDVKVYGPVTTVSEWGDPSGDFQRVTHNRPDKAAVLTADGSLRIVRLGTGQMEAVVPVGGRPSALAISADGQTAYVASFDGQSVTKVDLVNNVAALSAGVGGSPTALTLGADGGVWVGGTGWTKKLDPSSLQVIQDGGVSGTVSGMGYSGGQNLLVLSVVQNPTTPDPASGGKAEAAPAQQSVRTVSLADLSTLSEVPVGPARRASSSVAANAVNDGGLLHDAVGVSVQFDNGVAFATVAGGFALFDLADQGAEIMRGATPCPVRAAAAGPSEKKLYMTMPDCNQVLSIPLP